MAGFGSSEVEVALLIRSDDPRQMAEEIAGLTAMGAYLLVPRELLSIHDLHFDTPEGSLAAQYVALRLRTIGTEPWITLKGPARQTAWGGTERMELEMPWSPEAVGEVAEALRTCGVRVRAPQFTAAAPPNTMVGMGLAVIQDRETRRWPRNVVRADDPDQSPRAELAVDCVTFHLARDVVLYEVEIEAKADDGPAAARSVADDFVARYGPTLRRWPHGKLATGLAAGALLSRGALDGLLASGNLLSPEACDRIEEYLTSRER